MAVIQLQLPGSRHRSVHSFSSVRTPAKSGQFIPYGATLTNLFVKDKNGEDVDVVLGYDDVDFYRMSKSIRILTISNIGW